MAKKIVRLQVSFDGKAPVFYIDNAFDAEKSNQENCDNALAFLVNAIKSGEVLAFTEVSGDQHTPAIIALSRIAYVLIHSAKVYELKEDAVQGQ